MEYDSRIAIVTGAARGIGKEIAMTLADIGIVTVIADIDLDKAKKVVEEIRSNNGTGWALKVDVSKKEEVNLMIEKTIKKYSQVDILVNNAGIGYIKPFEELTEDEWDRVMEINLKSVFLCSQAVFPVMKKNKKGLIINLSSQAGKTGGLMIGANYSASKGGVIALTKSLARIGAKHNIRVNGVSPGLIQTDLTEEFSYDPDSVPVGRIGKPEDVAGVVEFLV